MAINKDQPLILSANNFPVIGIGASAGGLDAFKRFVSAIPEHSGMAYVLVQHLDPNHESFLTELLQKVTNIPVLEISDEIKVAPDHIYIIPSNKMLIANDGILLLNVRPIKSAGKLNLPIDLFFSSLAEVHQARAIGVVLSGMGSDGTMGLKSIKEHGGITFSQSEESAAYGGMPANAVKHGVVDYILLPEEIPKKLLEIKNQLGHDEDPLPNAGDEQLFKQILSLLRIRKGNDFTHYKQTTVRRRILRRMVINTKEDLGSYLHYLQENKTEQDSLYQDMLIPVTSFFRDSSIFENLCVSVFPKIFKNKAAGEPVRIWIAGCSQGQEAYSIAICIREYLGEHYEKVQIFATDISQPAIIKARSGCYSESDVEGVGSDRLRTFFRKKDENYVVNKDIRSMCVFAVHNFLKDPPFGKIDFLSCRNVLIYMEPYLQKKAFTTFHYALNPTGFLMLGKSETIGSSSTLFATAEKNDKLFICQDVPRRFMQVASRLKERQMHEVHSHLKNDRLQTDFRQAADELLLNKYTSAGVIVNASLDILDFRGNTDQYLGQGPGKPSHNLLRMAKEDLVFDIRSLLHKVKKDNVAAIKENIALQFSGKKSMISIEAVPLPNMADPHYLVLFYKTESADLPLQPLNLSPGLLLDKKDIRIDQLEKEIIQTHQDISVITEDQEASNDALQSANEELQSLNEELEASREELQSTNEELTVLNNELTSLNQQATVSRNYAEAVIATIREPLIVMDKHLRVKTANTAFYKAFKVNMADTEGVFIYDLGNGQWNIPLLRTLLEENLPQKKDFSDFEVKHYFPGIGERVMLLNTREMTTENEEETLILLAIQDITEQKKHQISELLFSKELEAKVEQRTNQLSEANELLRQKNEELGNMNRELESFTYVSSHDLQEPLRKIQTFASRIIETELDGLSPNGKDYFRRIHNAAKRMRTLIEDLLAYSSTNNNDQIFEKTDLGKIIHDVQTEQNDLITAKQAIIKSDNLGEAFVIPFQFRQVMSNLLTNALKFSKPGQQPYIEISTKNGSGLEFKTNNAALTGSPISLHKNYIQITFADNGIGFDPKYKDKIFVVFQRLHSKEEYAGTGIGLAIVKKIIDNHNGIITATSTSGNGTRFDLYIPDLPSIA